MINSDGEQFDYDKLITKLDKLIEELQNIVIHATEETRIMRDLADSATSERDEFFQLAQVCEDDKKQAENALEKAQEELKRISFVRDGLKTDVTNLKAEIKLLTETIEKYESGLIATAGKISELVEMVQIDYEDVIPGVINVKIEATGIFVCRAGDQYDSFCLGVFNRLKQRMPQIDFGDEPMFVRSDMGHNRPVSLNHKQVDVIVIFAAGFSHSDVTAIKKCIPDDIHVVVRANHLIQIIQDLMPWLDSRRSVCTSS